MQDNDSQLTLLLAITLTYRSSFCTHNHVVAIPFVGSLRIISLIAAINISQIYKYDESTHFMLSLFKPDICNE